MTAVLSFARLCRNAIELAALAARAAGEKFTYDQLEKIIDQLDEGRIPPESPPTPKSSNPSPFGDRKVIPPTPEQVTAYSASIGYPMDGQKWCDHYGAKGWMVGRTKMKDWQCAIRNWKSGGWGDGTVTLNGAEKQKPKDSYDRF